MKRFLSPFFILFCATLMAAESAGYKIVHPDGTVEFTDDATRGGEEIKLRDVQTIRKQVYKGEGERARPNPDELPSPKAVNKPVEYSGLVIVSPGSGETIWFEESGVTVSVSIKPELSATDSVVLFLDGAVRTRGRSSRLNISQVARGTHTLKASVVDEQGKTLISSPSVTFYLRQHSN